MAETPTIKDLFAVESNINPGKFSLFGIAEGGELVYAVRHGRVDELREWRLDNLGILVKELGFDSIEVRFNK
ncbi:hypothetical protein PSSHI_45180 [Photobacterium sp. R1]